MSRLPIHSEYATAVLKCVHNPILVNCSQKRRKKLKTETKNQKPVQSIQSRYGFDWISNMKKEVCIVASNY